jgi:outer membrane protein assembly factor BamE (lipoprotein component of BamABCDE complex)
MRRETTARQRKDRLRHAIAPSFAPGRIGRNALMLLLAAVLPLAGCESTVIKHGTQFHEGDLQQIQPGMTEEQVRMNLGTPATTAVVGTGQAYYYISSTHTQSAFFLPSEQDRQVVAVYFSPGGTVDKVANYGMKDGKVFDYVSRTTPAPGGHDEGLLKQIFRNLGTRQIFGE